MFFFSWNAFLAILNSLSWAEVKLEFPFERRIYDNQILPMIDNYSG